MKNSRFGEDSGTQFSSNQFNNQKSNLETTENKEIPLPTSKPKTNHNLDFKKALNLSLLFFDAQYSGFQKNYKNRVPWKRDSHTTDGAQCPNRPELDGGYYADGTHVKHLWPISYSAMMLSFSAISQFDQFSMNAYNRAGQRQYMTKTLKTMADYITRSYNAFGSSRQALKISFFTFSENIWKIIQSFETRCTHQKTHLYL